MNNTGRQLILHPALLRPILLAGAERRLVMLNLTLIAILIFCVGFSVMTCALAFLLGTCGHAALVKAARIDAQHSSLYLRHLRYDGFYQASALPLHSCKSSYQAIPKVRVLM